MKKTLGIFVILMLVCFLTTLWNVRFLLADNLSNTIRWTSFYALIGVGVSFVIVTGGIDLSIGSVIALTGVVLPMLLSVEFDPSDSVAVVRQVIQERPYRIQTSAPLGVAVDDRLVQRSASGQSTRYLTVVGERPLPDGQSEIEVRELVPDSLVGVTLQASHARHMSVPLACFLVLLIAAVIGLIHGLLITKVKLQPFVVTLCGLLIYRGLARFLANDAIQGFGTAFTGLKRLANGTAFHVPAPFLKWISEGHWSRWLHDENGNPVFGPDKQPIPLEVMEWVPIPMTAIWLCLVALFATLFFGYSVHGRYLLALGRNEQAARYSGINTDRMVILAYVICSLTAGLTGILFSLGLNSIQPGTHGNLYELYAIAAAVLGGCSLRGGTASVAGVIVGAALLRVLVNAVNLTPLSKQIEFSVIGLVILAGAITDEALRWAAARRRARLEASPPT